MIINEAKNYLNQLTKFINNFTISIKSPYKSLLNDLLTKQNIHISENAPIKIIFNCKDENAKYFDYYIYKLTCNLNITNKTVLFSQEIKAAGKSLLNYKISKSIAQIELKKKLENIFNQLF